MGYHGNVTNPLIKNMGPEAFSTALLIAFDVSENDYELGLTKIFFKPAKAGKPLSDDQNAKITKWVVQKRIKQMVGTCRSFLELRKRVRLTRAENRWKFSGRVASLLGGTVCNHLEVARRQILERKQKEGALAIQSFFRSTFIRSRYLKRIDKVRKAVRIVWTSYRRWQDRAQLQVWVDKKVEETRERERIQREKEEKERREREERERKEEEARKAAMDEQQRKEEMEKYRAEQQRKREEAEKKAKEEAEAAEAKRLAEEKKRLEEEERKRAEEKAQKEKEQKEAEAAAAAQLELERQEALKRQDQASITIKATKKVEDKAKKIKKREKRE